MKINVLTILKFSKLLVVFITIYAMIFQPLLQSYDSIEYLHYELVDTEKESDKNEERIDKDEKVKLQFLSFYATHCQFIDNSTIYSNQVSKRDIVLEIPIPPPDKV